MALAKYWSNKRCGPVVLEAMECLGGSGFVEEGPLPLLYREAPLNAIWEGSGNIICLDVLRTLQRAPEALDHVLRRARAAAGATGTSMPRWRQPRTAMRAASSEAEARRFVETLALLLQASLLMRHAARFVADTFVADPAGRRLGPHGRHVAKGHRRGRPCGDDLARLAAPPIRASASMAWSMHGIGGRPAAAASGLPAVPAVLGLAEVEQVHVAAPRAHQIRHGVGGDALEHLGELRQRLRAVRVVRGRVDQYLEAVIGGAAESAQHHEQRRAAHVVGDLAAADFIEPGDLVQQRA